MSPLLERDLEGVIACIRSPLRPLGDRRNILVKDFIAQVNFLSQQLPPGQYALNLCANRYLFLLAFCAVILRRQVNLLPPNKNLATQKQLAERYPGTYIIHDLGAKLGESARELQVAENLNAINLAEYDLQQFEHSACPMVDGVMADSPMVDNTLVNNPMVNSEQLCAISFTSGSTGESAANLKYWRTLRDSSRINVRYMLSAALSPASLLATVPGQHMWGLETSILNVLFSNLCVSDSRPLFPKDVQANLAAMFAPRVMVSTPVHLRALLASGLEFPQVERVLCATAPLEQQLAQQVETVFRGELCEIYGCSEAGSMAFRRTSREQAWRLFDGFEFKVGAHKFGEIHAQHLPQVVPLQDVVEILAGNQFLLRGRQADMVEIAGKRGSLQEINQALLALPGVADGVVFLPTEDTRRVPRLVALVVAPPNFDKQHAAAQLRHKLDGAFVPRPIYRVAELPREESGKLSKKRIEALWRSLQIKA